MNLRRLAIASLVAVAVALPASADPGVRVVADRIYFNGPIETLDVGFTRHEALAVAGGHILAVGRIGDVLRTAGAGTRFVNLHGRTLLPGFVVAHTHLLNEAAVHGLTLDQAQMLGLAQGITTVGTLWAGPAFVDRLDTFLANGGQLVMRNTLYLGYATNCGDVIGDWYLDHPLVTDPEAMLRVIGIKVYADGGSCGRWATTFPLDPEGSANSYGDLWFDQAEMDAIVAQADAAGYQVAIHALGDRGRDVALTAIDHALNGRPNVLRHRVEHDSLVRPDQLPVYARLDVPLVMLSTSGTCMENAYPIEAYIPDASYAWFHPLSDEIAAGLHVAWSTDYPYRPLETFHFHLYQMVTGKQVDTDGTICEPNALFERLRISVRQALRIMTLGAAYALRMEDAVGSLEPGKLADLIVVSDDPLAIDPDGLADIRVLSTVVGGIPRYCAAGAAELCR